MTVVQERRATPDFRAAVIAGIVAGLIFMMLEMILVPLFMGGSPWMPPRMIAAIVMGQEVLQATTFDTVILVVAIVVHMVLSILYAVILAGIVHRLDVGAALLAGAFFGLVLYFVNFYGLTLFFEWFANARNWVSIFSHLMFGVIAAWVYKAQLTPQVEMRSTAVTPAGIYE